MNAATETGVEPTEAGNRFRFSTTDPDEFVEHLRPISDGLIRVKAQNKIGFRANLSIVLGHQMRFLDVRMAQTLVTSQPRGTIGIDIPLDGPLYLRGSGPGRIYEPGEAFVRNSSDPFTSKTAEPRHALVPMIEESCLKNHLFKLCGGVMPESTTFESAFSLRTPAGETFMRYLSFVWQQVLNDRQVSSNRAAMLGIEDSLIALFIDASGAFPADPRIGDINASRVHDAEDFILSHLTDPISLGDVAEAVGVCARTLSRSFAKHHNAGPMAFLKMRRLEAVRQTLLIAEPSETTVAKIAARYQLFHLGRFSAAYRSHFGELPSRTLAHRQPRWTLSRPSGG
jgi:AraC-like DNA-binding protein